MKKNPLKKSAAKLDLGKIEIDALSDSMLSGLQGGYATIVEQSYCKPCGGTNLYTTCACPPPQTQGCTQAGNTCLACTITYIAGCCH